MKIFAFGSSIVSSYWNGAATYYRGCYKYLARLGHDITFAEPDAYGRQQHRDSDNFSYVTSLVYNPRERDGGADLDRMLAQAARADIVVKHSGIGCDDAELEHRVPAECSQTAMTFIWDVDAPATIHRMRANPVEDALALATRDYDAVLTYGGGPQALQGFRDFGARAYYSFYNGLDPETHHPVPPDPALACDVAFLGNRLPDREARVDELFLRAAALAFGPVLSARWRRLGRQAHAAQRPLDRPRPHRRPQPCQLLRRHGPQHQPSLHGRLRLLAAHSRVRGRGGRYLPALRRLARHR